MTLKARLAKLENQQPPLPWLSLTQDLENPDVFYELKKGDYRIPIRQAPEDILHTYGPADIPELEKRFTVILILWQHTEIPGGHPIEFDWEDTPGKVGL